MTDQRLNKKTSLNKNNYIIYVKGAKKIESIELSEKCTVDDVESVLRSICGANKHDIIKLTNYQNFPVLLNQSSLKPNLPNQPYHIEVVHSNPKSCSPNIYKEAKQSLHKLKIRVENIERKTHNVLDTFRDPPLLNQSCEYDSYLVQYQTQFKKMSLSRSLNRERLEDTRLRRASESPVRCSTCPYFSNRLQTQKCVHLSDLKGSTSFCKWSGIEKTHKQVHSVWRQYQAIQNHEIKQHIKESLKQISFNMWNYTDAELIHFVKFMFVSLEVTDEFRIPLTTLESYLFAVYQNYNCVPFHNFTHAFCVVQMLYAVIHYGNLRKVFDSLEILIMMFSALSHDLDHPGLSNSFQINAKTCLAKKYNYQSPLEHHHCEMAFQILEGGDKNIFKNLTESQMRKLKEITIKCLLSTDMAKHSEIVNEFRSFLSKWDFINDPSHRVSLMVVIIKLCDISNEVRPQHISELWLERLLEEFFQQSDMEKQRGLPWAPFMDREKTTKSNSQCGFISYVIIPLFELFTELFPTTKQFLLNPVKSQLDFYTKLQNKIISITNNSISNQILHVGTPTRKSSTFSNPSRKFSSGSMTRKPSCTIIDAALTPVRKASLGSISSRKSSTGSMVAANS